MKLGIQWDTRKLRKLVGDELDELQAFPAGLTDSQRVFCIEKILDETWLKN